MSQIYFCVIQEIQDQLQQFKIAAYFWFTLYVLHLSTAHTSWLAIRGIDAHLFQEAKA